jgi:hypothetical protein
MCEDCFTEGGIWKPCEHHNLHASHDLARAYAKCCETKNAITVTLHQALQEPLVSMRLRARSTAAIGI